MAANNKRDLLLARLARERFVGHAAGVLPKLADSIREKLSGLMDQSGNAREMQDRRDAWASFQSNQTIWVQATAAAWKKALTPSNTASARLPLDSGKFELMSNEVMENRILASRLALRLLDSASWELNDLRLRVQSLEDVPELAKEDILRPEVLSQNLVEQWTLTPLSRESWLVVQDLIQQHLMTHLLEAYRTANEFLIKEKVMVDIDRRASVKRTASAVAADRAGSSSRLGAASTSEKAAPAGSGGGEWGPSSGGSGSGVSSSLGAAGKSGRDGSAGRGAGSSDTAQARSDTLEETRMQTGTSPLARARMRAQGVMGHLRRLLSDHVVDFDHTNDNQPSPKLAQAMSRVQDARATAGPADAAYEGTMADAGEHVYGSAEVEQAAGTLRQRSIELKQAASTSSEKATIEIGPDVSKHSGGRSHSSCGARLVCPSADAGAARRHFRA